VQAPDAYLLPTHASSLWRDWIRGFMHRHFAREASGCKGRPILALKIIASARQMNLIADVLCGRQRLTEAQKNATRSVCGSHRRQPFGHS